MDYVELGKTGISVSRLAFGVLTIGPLQRDISVAEGSEVIREALNRGVTFLDAAQSYGTYDHIFEALKGYNGEVVIASKSTVADYHSMEEAVEEALEKLGRNQIEIFLLHAVQKKEELIKREGAWKCLLDMRAKGIVKAIGLSTHNIDVFEQVIDWPDMEVLHPIFNKLNFGIINNEGKAVDEIIRKAYQAGKGIYAMKPLAGGHLVTDLAASLRYALDFPYMHAVTVGMVTREELDINLKIYHNETLTADELEAASRRKKMFISFYCRGCALCLGACAHGAITMKEEKAFIADHKCILCGYCRKACPHSMIRVI